MVVCLFFPCLCGCYLFFSLSLWLLLVFFLVSVVVARFFACLHACCTIALQNHMKVPMSTLVPELQSKVIVIFEWAVHRFTLQGYCNPGWLHQKFMPKPINFSLTPPRTPAPPSTLSSISSDKSENYDPLQAMRRRRGQNQMKMTKT